MLDRIDLLDRWGMGADDDPGLAAIRWMHEQAIPYHFDWKIVERDIAGVLNRSVVFYYFEIDDPAHQALYRMKWG